MSQIHILTGSTSGVYTVVVHATTPAGNNSAGVPWSTALVNAGVAQTVMTEGAGPGQITTAEKATVLNGTVMEGVFQWQDTLSMTNAQRVADISLRAGQLIAEMQSERANQLKFFGYNA